MTRGTTDITTQPSPSFLPPPHPCSPSPFLLIIIIIIINHQSSIINIIIIIIIIITIIIIIIIIGSIMILILINLIKHLYSVRCAISFSFVFVPLFPTLCAMAFRFVRNAAFKGQHASKTTVNADMTLNDTFFLGVFDGVSGVSSLGMQPEDMAWDLRNCVRYSVSEFVIIIKVANLD